MGGSSESLPPLSSASPFTTNNTSDSARNETLSSSSQTPPNNTSQSPASTTTTTTPRPSLPTTASDFTLERVGELLYSASATEMIPLDSIRSANAQAKTLSHLVAVFIGGTGGIGESTAKEFFLRTTSPKAYIVGRSETRGKAVVDELHDINPGGKAIFWKCDISLLRNVDDFCRRLADVEGKVHCLFLTAGYMTLKGRNETPEGLDRKMVVNYYARIRFVTNLMPLLGAASAAGEISRVITVLAAGSEGEVRVDDLDLKNNFSLHACLAHCVVMSDFAMEELAKRHPGTSFSHSYPGTVKTGIANELTGPVRLAVKVLYAVMSPWILNIRESGERHFFQMTNQCYPSSKGRAGLPRPDGMESVRGTDGRPGSGAYLLDWDGKATGDEKVLSKYRDMGMGKKVWEHTMKMFAQAEARMEKEEVGEKRGASGEADGGRERGDARGKVADPPGWRPAS